MSSDIENRFLQAVKRSYEIYLESGSKSNKRLKALHGWVQSELTTCLDDPEYKLEGLSDTSSKERKVSGWYYDKNSDVVVTNDNLELGVVSVKFPVQSYMKNKINMFEQQLGETANLRMKNIVFGHLCVFPNPLPNVSKGKITKYEMITDSVISIYAKLAADHQNKHAPDIQGIAVVKINLTSDDKVDSVSRVKRNEVNLSNENWDKLQISLSVDRFIEVMCDKLKSKYVELK